MADSFATQPIAPVNPVIGVRPVEVPLANQQATATQTQLAVLPAGTIVEGFVLSRDNQNNPILRTPLGDLQLQSELFIKTGSQVIFRVDTTTASRARIVSIDGATPDEYAAHAARGLSTDTIEPSPLPQAQPQAATARNEPAPPTNNATLPALLLAKAATANPSNNPLIASLITSDTPLPPELQKLVSGSALKVTVLDLQFPEAVPAHAEAPVPTAQPRANVQSSVAPLLGNNPPSTPNTPATPLIQTFAESQLFIPQAQAPAAPAPQAAVPSPSPALPNPTAASANPTVSQSAPTTPSNQPIATSPPAANAPQLSAAPLPPPTTTTSATQPTASAPAALPLPSPPATPTPIANLSSPAYASIAQAQSSSSPSAAPTFTSAPAHTQPNIPGLQAVVIGHEPDGGNVLHSNLGTIKLFTPRPLPVGSTLALAVKPDETIAANPLAPANAAITPPLTPRSRDWPLPSEPQQPVNSAEAPLSQPLLPQIPVANNALASGLLGFMAAVKSGDVRQWLGTRALEKLETDFPKLAARLKIDIDQMQDLWNNSPLQNWSSMLLPINVQGQIEHARLYIRDEDPSPDSAQKTSSGGQRFIMEVNLSHLGDMQFDGFVQSKTSKQFDLVIRTSRSIEPSLANEIRAIFETASHSTGYGGHLSFQRGEQHFVRPLAEMKGISCDQHTILA